MKSASKADGMVKFLAEKLKTLVTPAQAGAQKWEARIRREQASVEQLAQRAADIAYRLLGTMFVFD